MTISRGPLTLRGALCAFAAFALITTALVAVVPSAKAVENVPGTTIGYPNTFYAYANVGEQVDVVFEKTTTANATNPGDVTITLEGPGFAGLECKIVTADAVGTTCDFAAINGGPVVATQAGIWRVTFHVDAGTPAEHFYNLEFARGGFVWDIAVSDGVGEIPGRVWSDRYIMFQPLPTQPGGTYYDLTYWFQSAFGVLYEADYTRYNGIHSIFYADPVGIRQEGTCTPAYHSIFFNDAAFAPADGECGDGAFKLFFEQPDPSLPASAATWDGGTDWINPPVPDAPQVVNLTFTPDSTEINSGNVTFGVTNFPFGVVTLNVDTDGDGTFDGPGDCTAHVTPIAGNGEYHFDGFTCGPDPQPIPPSQEIAFEVIVDKIAEIHFVNYDVETRGGIEVTQLTGPGAGDKRIYWNDTYLDPNADDDPERNFAAPPLGRETLGGNWLTWKILSWPGCPQSDLKCEGATFVGDGVDSTGGVHGWEWPEDGTGLALGWGNNRFIDDWKFAEIADVVETLPVPPRTSTFAIEKFSDPVSGSEVESGDTISYSVSITNLDTPDAVGIANIAVSDDLSDVLDDATLTAGPTASSGSASLVGDTLTWQGSLAPGASVIVTYEVTVNAEDDLGDRVLRNVVSTDDERGVNCPPGAPGPECTTEHEVPELPDPPTPPEPETEVGGETEGPETEVGGATEGALAFTGAGFGYLVLVALMMLGGGVALFEATRRRSGLHRS